MAEGEEFVVIVPVDLTEEFDPSAGRLEYNATSSPAIDAAKRTPAFEVFGRFSQLPFWKITSFGDAIRVELIDLRFGTPEHPQSSTPPATYANQNSAFDSRSSALIRGHFLHARKLNKVVRGI